MGREGSVAESERASFSWEKTLMQVLKVSHNEDGGTGISGRKNKPYQAMPRESELTCRTQGRS